MTSAHAYGRRSRVTSTGLLIISLTFVTTLFPDVVGVMPESRGYESVQCYSTQLIGRCGTDQNLSPVQCSPGQPTCYLKIITYGNIYNCAQASSGLNGCKNNKCKKTTIIQKCTGNPSVCTYVSEESVDVMDGTEATGAICLGDPAGPPP